MAEIDYSPEYGAQLVNETDVDNGDVMGALNDQHPEIAALVRWTYDTRPTTSFRHGGIFERDRFVTPNSIFAQFRTAQEASETDDVVSGVLESTESLAINKMSVDCEDEDECVDEETEVLTLDGWTHHKNLEPGDHILTLNAETGLSEWLPVEWVVRKPAPEKLISLESRNLSALVTPNHRWLVRSGRCGSRLRFVLTTGLNSGHRVPLACPAGPSPVESDLDDDFVTLAGWFVTEGWWGGSKTGSMESTRCGIGQSFTANPGKCEAIEAALERLGVNYGSYDRPWGVRVFQFSGPVARALREHFPDKALTIDFVNALSVHQRRLLFDALVAADGHRKGTSHGFTTTSVEQMEAFSHLCLLLGVVTTTTVREPGECGEIDGRMIVSRKLQYHVHVLATRQAKVETMERAEIATTPETLVWCPHTTNGSFLARRRGTIYFTGNSDVWNQIMEDLELDARMREFWREDFICSQFYVAMWWGTRSYTVRGKSDRGIKRKRSFTNLKVPVGLSVLDPLKIIPVGNFLFGQEQLAYVADRFEYDVIRATLDGSRAPDQVISQLLLGPYEPDETERRMLQQDGCPADRLFLLNPNNVFRHTATRPQYKRFADVRMRSVFELLDLKSQLKSMDRAHLIGATNFIVLVTKGSDTIPGKPAEIAALQSQVRTLARVPVIVGDHRLDIKIITPDQDYVLVPEKYNGLDSRITARLFQMFMTGNYSAGAKGDDSLKLAKLVAKGLESRRHMIRGTFERCVLDPTYELNDAFTTDPELRFHPKRIALDFDPTFANFLLDLRDRGDLSRESILEEIDYDQYTEWRRRKNEKAKYDDVFETTVPYSTAKPGVNPVKQNGAPGTAAPGAGGTPPNPKSAGRRMGGNRSGGGSAPGSGQGQEPTDLGPRSKRRGSSD